MKTKQSDSLLKMSETTRVKIMKSKADV